VKHKGGLNAMEKTKTSLALAEMRTPDHPVRKLTTTPITLSLFKYKNEKKNVLIIKKLMTKSEGMYDAAEI
jgi:hypothetical protein